MNETFDSNPLSTRYQQIRSGQARIPINQNGIAVVHILPTCKQNLILSNIFNSNRRYLAPLVTDNNNLDQQLMDEVLVYFRKGTCYLEILPNGKIETAYSSISAFAENKIISYHLERAIYRSIRSNLNFYKTQCKTQIICPVKIKLALLNIKGYILHNSPKNNPTLNNEIIFDPEIISDFHENTINAAIHNLANKIWVSFGEKQSIHFDNEHRFIEN